MMKGHALASTKIPFLCLILGALTTWPGCGGDEKVQPSNTGGGSPTSSSTTASTGGSGGTGGCGDGCVDETLYVGAGKQLINPTIIESEWQDLNNDNYYEAGEPFTDVNGNGQFDATWIAGYGAGRPATGQNDDLEVRAIAIRHKDTTIVICILDAVGYFIDEMDRIRQDPKVVALNASHIIIGSTHTHEGVDTVGLWGENPIVSGLNPTYQQLTRDRAADAIVEAVNSLKPARMRIAQTVTVDPGGTLNYVNDTRDPIIYDPTLTIAQFVEDSGTGQTIATLVNWASHPEYAGSKNNKLSADYPHWLRMMIEQGFPSENIAGLGGTTVFVQGPLGGQVGPGGGVHPPDALGIPISQAGLPKAQAVGTNVAKLALKTLQDKAEDVSNPEITYRSTMVDARIDNLGYHFLASQGVFDRKFYNYDETQPPSETNPPWAKTRITYLQVGPMATITAPGELHPELWVGGYDGSWSWGQSMLNEVVNAPDMTQAPKGPYLREMMMANPGVRYAFVSGLAEDFLGYIVAKFNYVLDPNAPYFQEAAGDHYEETNSIGPLVEEHVQHPMLTLAAPQ